MHAQQLPPHAAAAAAAHAGQLPLMPHPLAGGLPPLPPGAAGAAGAAGLLALGGPPGHHIPSVAAAMAAANANANAAGLKDGRPSESDLLVGKRSNSGKHMEGSNKAVSLIINSLLLSSTQCR